MLIILALVPPVYLVIVHKVNVDGTLVLRAYYERNSYVVTFNDFDNTELKTQILLFTERIEIKNGAKNKINVR